ncbi:hypothetical protein E8P82_12365 [Arthrobacter echini]|uniref:Uncharacterized protein n=1 Tax=Arthrobacter echini TaxID=1529066 RepID=A0A4S5E2E6_9MICC|nr:hypothetical protein [Arthrobacter echini]THJ65527.1 hypothetical protein E8P82_12365 [Arthrobacter echini]
MALFGDGIGQFLRILPDLIKTSLTIETKTDPGRVNLVLCLTPMILIAVLDAALDGVNTLLNAALLFFDKIPYSADEPGFDWGLPIAFLIFTVICMFFTTFSFLKIAQLKGKGEGEGSG